MKAFLTWLDHRTGYQQQMNEALWEKVPSGARWRYVTGSMLVFAFVTQAITGIFLWMAYSPSSQTAWESVYYIQHEMWGGWFVRGIHHFMAQAMVVVLALHLLQVVIDGAYRAPREVNYWLGLILMKITLGLGLTGYLLPWDQKGYWATSVATNLMTLVPFAGTELQQIVVGGKDYGHATLTRFFALHAGVLPAALVAFLGLHIMVFRRHGITAHITPGRKDQYFWPHQVLLDSLACLAMLAVVVLCVIQFNFAGLLSGQVDTGTLGAELGAPADPSEQYSAARPEWYYLFLFQLLKYFEGSTEWIGAIVLPGAVVGLLFLMPIIGRSNWGHRFNVLVVLLLIGGAGVLTALAMVDDNYDRVAAKLGWSGEPYEKKIQSAREFHEAKEKAEHDAARTIALVQRRQFIDGKLSAPLLIPKQGAVYLLRNDPLTQGPRLFEKHCASCHTYAPAEGAAPVKQPDSPSAPNLAGFATRRWLTDLLDPEKIAAPALLGSTAHKDGRMVQWVKQHGAKLSPEDKAAIVAALSAQARLRGQAAQDATEAELVGKGVTLIERNCANGCHKFGNAGQDGLAPDLTGYGSYEWLMGFISDPGHERFYRVENDRMPAFAQDLSNPANHALSIREISLVVDWLRGDYYRTDDEQPTLPHSEETARLTVAASRTTTPPRPVVVGSKPASETATARAARLFRQNCSACHSHQGPQGAGIVAAHPSAPNLFGFGSRVWLSGLLDPQRIASPEYFGGTSHSAGDMVGYVNDNLGELDDAKRQALGEMVAALSAEAKLPGQAEADQQAEAGGVLQRGRQAFAEAFACTDCHKLGEQGETGSAPDLTGWGSKEWLLEFLKNPGHERFYGEGNDRMPAFAAGAGTKKSLLTDEELSLLIQWLRGEKLE